MYSIWISVVNNMGKWKVTVAAFALTLSMAVASQSNTLDTDYKDSKEPKVNLMFRDPGGGIGP